MPGHYEVPVPSYELHSRNSNSHHFSQTWNGHGYLLPYPSNIVPRINQPHQTGVSTYGQHSTNSTSYHVNQTWNGHVYQRPYSSNVGPRIYWPQQIGVRHTATENRNRPQLRILPQDEVAILEISGFHEVRNFNNGNRTQLDIDNMRYEEVAIIEISGFHEVRNFNNGNRTQLDIDNMSYEELQTLQERVGKVKTGLTEETILSHLKTRIHVSSLASYFNLDESAVMDQETEICTVCQDGYKNQEKIATLDCGHEYHADCIKHWLLVNNVCPICKRQALAV